ncbi:hypothetical protein [Hydrogenophaga sp. BPS33]|uniref:hypothetical protein n=1 Tax=Hydrogenophaga sp. BPS33 TaxID=2651974 RepID=UPI0013200448|nr:hypothetical protein [Hydrogenophaga sp. BPS33]QHE86774.1 hypothetical protein F9K07_18655 [Hydrogenophaga sp. BPS33]
MAKQFLQRVDSRLTPRSLMANSSSLAVSEGSGTGGHERSKEGHSPRSETTHFDKLVHGDSTKPTWTKGELWNDKVLTYQKMLKAVLEASDAPDVALVEKILKALVDEKYSIYPGFDGSQQKINQATSAVARRMSDRADLLIPQVKDPASRLLLENTAKFWKSYVRPEPETKPEKPRAAGIWRSSSKRGTTKPVVVDEPPPPRAKAATFAGRIPQMDLKLFTNITSTTVNSPRHNPTTSTTSPCPLTVTTALSSESMSATGNTPASAAQTPRLLAASELTDPEEIKKRAKQREGLYAALATRGPQAITFALADVPQETNLASYFPLGDPGQFREEVLESAQQFVKTFFSDDELIAYLDWCQTHAHLTTYMGRILDDETGVKKVIKPEVIELCMALRAVDDTAETAALEKNASAIQKAMSHKNITALALAQQPFASTKMMMQKCMLLKNYSGREGKDFDHFLQTLENAHTIRKAAHAGLQHAVLMKPLKQKDVLNLAVSAYARVMTTPTLGYLPPDTPQTQLKVIDGVLEAMIKRPAKPLNPLQLAALTHVRESLQAHASKPH